MKGDGYFFPKVQVSLDNFLPLKNKIIVWKLLFVFNLLFFVRFPAAWSFFLIYLFFLHISWLRSVIWIQLLWSSSLKKPQLKLKNCNELLYIWFRSEISGCGLISGSKAFSELLFSLLCILMCCRTVPSSFDTAQTNAPTSRTPSLSSTSRKCTTSPFVSLKIHTDTPSERRARRTKR